MNTSITGLIQIIDLEGIICRIYYDSVNVRTLGIGATISEIPNIDKIPLTKYFDLDYILNLFMSGIKKYERGVDRALKVKVSQEQYDALVSICYNIGVGGLSGSTFMRLINAKAPINDIRKSIMLWTKQKELISRRTKEARLFCDRVYSTDGTANMCDTNGAGKPLYRTGKRVNVKKLLEGFIKQDPLQSVGKIEIVEPAPIESIKTRDLTMDDIWIIAKNVYGALTE